MENMIAMAQGDSNELLADRETANLIELNASMLALIGGGSGDVLWG